jgi:hypothetical protein
MCRIVLAAVLVLAASAVASDRPDVPGCTSSGSRVVCQTDRGQSLTDTQSAPTPAWTVLEQMNGGRASELLHPT